MKIWYPGKKLIIMLIKNNYNNDNQLHKGEFIVRMVFLCIESQKSGLKIEGHIILSI